MVSTEFRWTRQHSRLAFLGASLLVGCMVLSVMVSRASASTKRGESSLIVSGWGGAWSDCETSTVVKPFEKKYHVNVTLSLLGSSTQIYAQLRAQKGHPSMDVVLIGGGLEKLAGNQGLMAKINWAKQAPNWNNLTPLAKYVPKYGPSVAMTGVGIGYNYKDMPYRPSSWLDFFDPQLKGHIAVSTLDANYGLAYLAFLNAHFGGTQTNVDPGFNRLKDLSIQDPVIVDTDQDQVNALVQKNVWMTIMTNSRALQLQKQGYPIRFIYPDQGGFFWGNYAGVPVGSPHQALAIKYINFYLSPAVQANWAKCVNYAPSNTKTKLGAYPFKAALTVPKIYPLNWDWINANRAAWIDRWNTEIAPAMNP